MFFSWTLPPTTVPVTVIVKGPSFWTAVNSSPVRLTLVVIVSRWSSLPGASGTNGGGRSKSRGLAALSGTSLAGGLTSFIALGLAGFMALGLTGFMTLGLAGL